MKDEIRISLERIEELTKKPGLAIILKNGCWLYTWASIYVKRPLKGV